MSQPTEPAVSPKVKPAAKSPVKITSLMYVQICEMHAQGIPLSLACRSCDITPTTFYRFKARNPHFEPEFAAAREKFVLTLEERAFEAAMTLDPGKFPTMLIFMLKAHRPEVYRDSARIEHTGSVSVAMDFATAMERMSNSAATAKH